VLSPLLRRPYARLSAVTDDAAPAEDGGEYEAEEPAAPGIAVTALAGATGAAAAYYAGGPGGAALFTAATPFLAVVFQKTVNAISRDKSRRADRMLETAAEAAGLTPGELADQAMESEETRFLTDKAIEAAVDTIWPEGIRAIGRAYAAGLLAKDKPALNIRLRVLGIMQGLDELHVGLLELLVRYEPEVRQREYVAIPHRFPSYQNGFMGGDRPDNPKDWTAGRRKWGAAQIIAARPHLGLVLGSLLGELTVSGLVQANDTTHETTKRLSEDMAKQVNRQGGRMQRGRSMKPLTLQATAIPGPETSWSPTELGEKVLGFYAEAGTEDSPDVTDDALTGDR
jgi:hypothetical protein